jgi:hypothetical protein
VNLKQRPEHPRRMASLRSRASTGHQDIGMNGALVPLGPFQEPRQVCLMGLSGGIASISVVAPLNHAVGV